MVCVEPNPSFHPGLRRTVQRCLERAGAAGIDLKIRLFPGSLAEFSRAEPANKFDVILTWLVLCSVPHPVEAKLKL